MAGHRSLDPRMVVRIHRGQWERWHQADQENWAVKSRPQSRLTLTGASGVINLKGCTTMDGLSVPSHGAKLLSGTANKALAEEIARHMGIELCKTTSTRFADGELFVR